MPSNIPKIRTNWWYLIPIFLGLIGGIIAWFALKTFDRKFAKNCLMFSVFLDVFKVMVFVGLLMAGENMNLDMGIETISETSDFDIQFKFNNP